MSRFSANKWVPHQCCCTVEVRTGLSKQFGLGPTHTSTCREHQHTLGPWRGVSTYAPPRSRASPYRHTATIKTGKGVRALTPGAPRGHLPNPTGTDRAQWPRQSQPPWGSALDTRTCTRGHYSTPIHMHVGPSMTAPPVTKSTVSTNKVQKQQGAREWAREAVTGARFLGRGW